MDDGVWVELAFTGDVSMATAEAFVEGVDDFAGRFGLRLGVGAAHAASEKPWPGTALMLDVALKRMADTDGVSQQTMQAVLEDEARAQISTLT